MENWRRFQNYQIAEEEFKKILQEANCNAYGIDWDKLLIKAVENPNNDEAFDAVRKLFGNLVNKSKRKKADLRDHYGKITIINQSSHDLYDFRIAKTGPAFDEKHFAKGNPTFDKIYQDPDQFLPIYEKPFLMPGSGPGEFPGDLPMGSQTTFYAPNKIYSICCRWFPERYYSAPRQPREQFIEELSDASRPPGKYTTYGNAPAEPAAGLLWWKHLNFDLGINITMGDYSQLIKDVEWVIRVFDGQRMAEFSLDRDNPIRVPDFKDLEIIDHRETDK